MGFCVIGALFGVAPLPVHIIAFFSNLPAANRHSRYLLKDCIMCIICRDIYATV